MSSQSARLQIRPARMRDWPELARLWRVIFPAHSPRLISYNLRHHLGGTYVACDEGRLAGFYTLLRGDHPDSSVPADVVWLDMIALDPSLHGNGFGRELIADAERQAAAWGFSRMEMACDRDNTQAIGINRSRGYELLDRPGDRLSWACRLIPTGRLRRENGPLSRVWDRWCKRFVYLVIFAILTGR